MEHNMPKILTFLFDLQYLHGCTKILQFWYLLLIQVDDSCHNQFSSVQICHSVMSDSLWPHESQHARPPGPSPTPVDYSNSCSLIRWWNSAVLSSVVPFPSCPQSLPVSGSFPMNQLFAWGGQSIGISASASVLPMNTQDWPSVGWTGWTFFAVQGTLKSLIQHHSSKAPIFQCSAFSTVQLSHPYITTGKTIALTRQTFVGKVMSLLFNMLFRLVITFPPRSKCLLISWLQSPSAVILEPKKIKSDTASTVSPFISHEMMGPDTMILVFWMLSFKPTFSLFFTFIKRLFSSSSLSAIGWCYLHIWGYRYFSWQSWFQLVLLPAQRFS